MLKSGAFLKFLLIFLVVVGKRFHEETLFLRFLNIVLSFVFKNDNSPELITILVFDSGVLGTSWNDAEIVASHFPVNHKLVCLNELLNLSAMNDSDQGLKHGRSSCASLLNEHLVNFELVIAVDGFGDILIHEVSALLLD